MKFNRTPSYRRFAISFETAGCGSTNTIITGLDNNAHARLTCQWVLFCIFVMWVDVDLIPARSQTLSIARSSREGNDLKITQICGNELRKSRSYCWRNWRMVPSRPVSMGRTMDFTCAAWNWLRKSLARASLFVCRGTFHKMLSPSGRFSGPFVHNPPILPSNVSSIPPLNDRNNVSRWESEEVFEHVKAR